MFKSLTETEFSAHYPTYTTEGHGKKNSNDK